MRIITTFLMLLVGAPLLFGLNCSIDIAQFATGDRPYIDINLRVEGSTCKFVAEDNELISGSVLVDMRLMQGAEIKAFEKYQLNANNLSEIKDMLDLRRFFLESGKYDVIISISDINDADNKFEYNSNVYIHPVTQLKMSQALILAKVETQTDDSPLVRNGLYLETLPYMLIDEDVKQISLYQEVYTEMFDQDVLVHKIEFIKLPYEEQFYKSPAIVKFKKVGTKSVSPTLSRLDVSGLTSGNYRIKTSIIDRKKELLYSDSLTVLVNNTLADVKAFKSYNKVLENSFVIDIDSLDVVYALKAIVPITNYKMMSTIDYVIEKGSLEAQKYYLFKHWDDAYPALAEVAYTKYMEIVKAVDKDYYSTVGHGFQTDRGYIYLKYGKPSKFITVIDEPNTPPYEIWYYNYMEATNQTDVRFIFYDPLQVTNFELLHSTCYAEKSDPTWETKLYKFNRDEVIGHTINATEVAPNWGRKAKRLFNEF